MKYRATLSNSKRAHVAARQKYNCAACAKVHGDSATARLGATFHVDHVMPLWKCRARGIGREEANSLQNLVALHPGCHAAKTEAETRELDDLRHEARTGRSRFFTPGAYAYLPKPESFR